MENIKIIDWNDGKESIQQNGIRLSTIFDREEWFLENQEPCIIRNFPELTVEEAHLSNCVFENCGTIKIEDGTVSKCVFSNTQTIYFNNTNVYDSKFENLSCNNGDFIISLEDAKITNCTFNNIKLENDVYLADGVGDCLVKKCIFKNVFTTRSDKELFFCQDFEGKVFRRLKTYDMVDRESCIGLGK